MNRNGLLLLFLLCLAELGAAQVDSSGRHSLRVVAVDTSGAALRQVAVLVYPDTGQAVDSSSPCAFSMTDGTGGATVAGLSAGRYTVRCSLIGYAAEDCAVELPRPAPLGITLHEEQVDIQSVVVQGQRCPVKMKQDGYEIGVKGIREGRSNALDLVRGLPYIVVKGDEVAVLGKQHIVLQIGDVVQRIEASALSETLKSYDAKLIDRVELVLDPPLRYNSDGNTALLVLHTASVFTRYMGGTVGTEEIVGLRCNNRYGGYGTLVFNRERFSTFINPSYNYTTARLEERSVYSLRGVTRTIENFPSSGAHNPYFRMGGQYALGKESHVGVALLYSGSQYVSLFSSREEQQDTATHATRRRVEGQSQYDSKTHKLSGTLYGQAGFGEMGGRLWADLSVYNFSEANDSRFTSKIFEVGTAESGLYGYRDDDRVGTFGVSSKLEAYVPLDSMKRFTLEGGATYHWNRTRNDRAHEETPGVIASSFIYDEHIVSPYVSLLFRHGGRYSLRVGSRYAATVYAPELRQAGTVQKERYSWYGNVMPFLSFSYSASQRHRLAVNFETAIKRPNFQRVNPFRWEVAPGVSRYGNPDLRPETRYISDVSYTYGGSLSLGFRYSYDMNLLREYTLMGQQDGSVITNIGNTEDSHFWGLTASYFASLGAWFQMSLNGFAGYRKYIPKLEYFSRSVYSMDWEVNSFFYFTFDSKKMFSGYISGNLVGPQRTSISRIDLQYNLGAGLSASLLKRRLNISVSGMNLLASRYSGYSLHGEARQDFRNYYSFLSGYLSLSYKFGTVRPKREGSSLSNTESNQRF